LSGGCDDLSEQSSLLQTRAVRLDVALPDRDPDPSIHGLAGVEFSTTATIPLGHKEEFHFLINGDWGCGLNHPASTCNKYSGGQTTVAKTMAADAAAAPVDFVINGGDAMYTYGVLNREDPKFDDTFTEVYAYESLQVPWYGVLGNHDWKMNASALIFHSGIWNIPATSYILRGTAGDVDVNLFFIDVNVQNKGEICYERNQSAWGQPPYRHLDEAEMEQCRGEIQKVFDDQKAWLRGNLAAARGWKIVIYHEPAFIAHKYSCTVGPEKYDTDCNFLLNELVPILKEGGVHAVINAHDHLLSHEVALGLDQFVVGYGGAERAGEASVGYWDDKASIDVHPETLAVFANDSNWGYARASVNATHLAMHFTLTSEADPTPRRVYSYYVPFEDRMSTAVI